MITWNIGMGQIGSKGAPVFFVRSPHEAEQTAGMEAHHRYVLFHCLRAVGTRCASGPTCTLAL